MKPSKDLPHLLAMTARIMRWLPMMVTMVFAVTAVVVARYVAPHDEAMLGALRRATVFLAIGAAFLMDDPASTSVASVPTPLWVRRGIRAALALAAVYACWVVIAVVAAPHPGSLPFAALALELAVLVSAGWVIAIIAARAGRPGGATGAPAVLVASWLLPLLPTRWTLLGGSPGEAMWADAHMRWLAILGVSLAALAALSADPARRAVTSALRREPVEALPPTERRRERIEGGKR